MPGPAHGHHRESSPAGLDMHTSCLDPSGHTTVLSGSHRVSCTVPGPAHSYHTESSLAGLDMHTSCHCGVSCGMYVFPEALGRGTHDMSRSPEGTPRSAGIGSCHHVGNCSSRVWSWKPKHDRNPFGDDCLHWVAYTVSNDVVVGGARGVSLCLSTGIE